MFDKELFGNRIRYYRKSKELTLDLLAEKVDIEPQYLSSIEAGKHTPTLKVIVSLINQLEINYNMLMNYSDYDESLTFEIINKANNLTETQADLVFYYLQTVK